MSKKKSRKDKYSFVPFDSNHVQEKFINFIMKDGKKSLARKIFSKAMDNIKKVSKGSVVPEDVFKKAIDCVKPQFEVRSKRVGGAVYQVPAEVKQDRQLTLAMRWILNAVRSKKGKAFYISLSRELIEASNGNGIAVKKREDVQKMADANKAFSHFANF